MSLDFARDDRTGIRFFHHALECQAEISYKMEPVRKREQQNTFSS